MPTGFFKHIPNINYDFKSDGKYYQAKDLFRKVSVWEHLQEGVTGYSYYRITEGERPEIVSARLYSDSTLYWTFWLVNENLQDLSDWPKSQRVFEKFLDRKYSGKCLVAANSTDIVSYDHSLDEDKQLANRKFVLGEKVSQSSSVYGFVTDVNPTHNRITVQIPLNVVDVFTSGSTVTGATSGKSFTISSVQNERDAVNHYTTDVTTNEIAYEKDTYPYQGDDEDDPLWPDGTEKLNEIEGEEITRQTFRTTESLNNTVITNEKHELNLNEERHIIRYIPAGYIDRVVREFVSLVRD